MKFYLFSLAVLMLITNIEINWLFSSIKESSFDIGFIMYYFPSTFIIPCSIFDILNTFQILYLLRKLAFVI
jgi:hypothetical protein